jgi:hypothetical protein
MLTMIPSPASAEEDDEKDAASVIYNNVCGGEGIKWRPETKT